MPYISTVFPAKLALKTLLEAHTFPDTAPTISWGGPTESEDVTYDMVYFGPIRVLENEYITLGDRRIDEKYLISLIVEVYRFGDDEQATEQRAWQLRDGVMTVVAANVTLNGTVNRATGYRFRQENPVPTPQHWRSQILLEIAVVGFVFL